MAAKAERENNGVHDLTLVNERVKLPFHRIGKPLIYILVAPNDGK